MLLKDIGKIIIGKTPKTSIKENYNSNDICFITTEDLKNGFNIKTSNRYISNQGFKEIKNNSISGISIIVSCVGSDMGNVGITNLTCATNQQLYSITNIIKECNPYYLYYYLKRKKVYFHKLAGETAIPILTKSDFEKIDIPLPSQYIQNKIVEILSNIDYQIERNNNTIKRLQDLGNTIYSKNINKDTVFFTLDKNKIKTGKQDANFATPNGKYKFFTCSEEDFLCDSYEFEGKNILIAGNGNFNVKFYDGKFNAYQRTYIIKDDEIFGNLYYTYCYNTQSLLKSANGSIIKFMTIDMIKHIKIPYFSKEINNILNFITLEITKINCEIDKLGNLKQQLLPLLINDQLII